MLLFDHFLTYKKLVQQLKFIKKNKIVSDNEWITFTKRGCE